MKIENGQKLTANKKRGVGVGGGVGDGEEEGKTFVCEILLLCLLLI